MVDEKELKDQTENFKTSRQKNITVVTTSIIFVLISLCVFGLYAYKSNLFKEQFSKQMSTESEKKIATENIVEETLPKSEKKMASENIDEESLSEGEKLEFKNN